MRVFVQCPLVFTSCILAMGLSGRAVAQADSASVAPSAATATEEPEEVTVRGRRTLPQYRLERERARKEMFRIFNETNEGTDTDVRCGVEQPTGTRVRHTVCRTTAEIEASSRAARDLLTSLVYSTNGRTGVAGAAGNSPPPPPPPGNIGARLAQLAGSVGEKDALAQFEDEWKRILGDNRDLFRAVTKYVELGQEYALARGDTLAPGEQDDTVLLEATPASTSGPQCEASTLTEFEQRNNIARVSGTVSISSCPAGTTGSLTVVARVRDDAGETTPIEFKETWQRADAQDHLFKADYPIGENVFLQSVRVRDLTCTCAEPSQ
jgi:hypothetical protein